MTMKEYEKVIAYFQYVNFCGNASDPVFNPRFIDFLRLNYERGIRCEVHNAATGKAMDWYLSAFVANPNAKWIFGIDGYPEDSHLYRKNQNGPRLFDAMILGKEMGLDVTWRYIVFRYNENDIQECKKIADHYGVKIEFVHSSRFTKDDELKPTSDFIERDYENHTAEMFERSTRARAYS